MPAGNNQHAPDHRWEADCLRAVDACFVRHRLDDPHLRLLIAVSGGPDSMALALLLQRWAQRFRPQAGLQAAIVDHGLRPESALEAVQTAQALEKIGLSTRVLSVPDKRRHLSRAPLSNVQATARQWRFEALAAHARQIKAAAIVLGHHRRDQAETVIDRLARGSHMLGLSAMSEYHLFRACPQPVAVLRPLLFADPEHLRRYVDCHRLRFVDDPSNKDRRYRRVRLRHMIEQHPPLLRASLRLQRIAARQAGVELAAARKLWQKVVHHPLPGTAYGILEIGRDLCRAPPILQWRVMGSALRYVAQQEYPARHRQLQRLCQAMHRAEGKPIMKPRCLGGAVIAGTGAGFRVSREAVFLKPSFRLKAGESMIWDHRLEITAKNPVVIRHARLRDMEHNSPCWQGWGDMLAILCAVENVQTSASTLVPATEKIGQGGELADIHYRWQPKVSFAADLHKSGLLFSQLHPIY